MTSWISLCDYIIIFYVYHCYYSYYFAKKTEEIIEFKLEIPFSLCSSNLYFKEKHILFLGWVSRSLGYPLKNTAPQNWRERAEQESIKGSKIKRRDIKEPLCLGSLKLFLQYTLFLRKEVKIPAQNPDAIATRFRLSEIQEKVSISCYKLIIVRKKRIFFEFWSKSMTELCYQ